MKEITSIDGLRACLDETADKAAFLFKHSTTCPISARAHARVNDYIASAPAGVPEFRMVKVIESRSVSNAVAKELGVVHQSPQIVLVIDGKAVWSASHHNISPKSIARAIEECLPASTS